jgi:hypothetical protein
VLPPFLSGRPPIGSVLSLDSPGPLDFHGFTQTAARQVKERHKWPEPFGQGVRKPLELLIRHKPFSRRRLFQHSDRGHVGDFTIFLGQVEHPAQQGEIAVYRGRCRTILLALADDFQIASGVIFVTGQPPEMPSL